MTALPMDHHPKQVSSILKCHVLIVGCGLGGLAAAIAIRRAGHEVTILEKTAELQELGAGINISPNATVIFKEWGIYEAIKEKANIPYAGFMRSYKDSLVLSSQQLGHEIESMYSASYMVIHRADLHGTLLKEAKRLGVAIKLDSHIIKLDFLEPSIELSNGEKYVSDIILGADGERSACRETMLGFSPQVRESRDHVFRVTVNISEILEHENLVSFVQPPCINLWVGPGAHAMTYALKRDGLLNIVLTCAHDPAKSVDHGPQRVDIKEAMEAFSHWDENFKSLLGLAQGCSKWTLYEPPKSGPWIHPNGKFALIGDSAHAMLPFLGQGAAMAFEDAAVLGTLFSKLLHKSQLSDILSMYESIRKPRTMALRNRSHAMRDVLAFDDGPLQQERDRQLQEHAPFDGFPNFLADPNFQKSLFGYNAMNEAERAWDIYLRGEWPSTRGNWKLVSEAK